jgi:hypothetical protein
VAEVERILKVGRGSSVGLVLMETVRNHQVESLVVRKLVGEVRIPSERVLKWEAGRSL